MFTEIDKQFFLTPFERLEAQVADLEERVAELEAGGTPEPEEPENLLLWSNKFDEYATWQQFGDSMVAVQEVDDSWTIPFDAAPAGIFQWKTSGLTPETEYTFSVELKAVPTGSRIGLETNTSAPIVYRDITSEVNGTTFQRISITGSTGVGVTDIVCVVEAGAIGNILIQHAQLNTGDTVKPYIETTS